MFLFINTYQGRKKMGSRIKCLKCGDIIEGDGKGTYIQCKCKSCYIDETKWYVRVGGDPKYIVDADAEPEAEGQLSIYDLEEENGNNKR